MTQMQLFNNPVFGQLPVIVVDGEELFGAVEAALALTFAKPHDAIKNHVDSEDSAVHGVGVTTGKKADGSDAVQTVQKKFINESGLYSLIFGAAKQGNNPEIKEKAKQFKRWVTKEVLPSIRKTGSYSISQSNNEATKLEIQKQRAEAMLKNANAKQAKLLLDAAHRYSDRLPDTSLESLLAAGTKILTGQDLIPQRNVGQKFYTCEEIAKKIGMLSKNGKPHNQAVAALIKHIGFSDDEVVTVLESTGPSWQGTTDKYAESVLKRVEQKVQELGYPPVLNLGKSFNVFWAHQSA